MDTAILFTEITGKSGDVGVVTLNRPQALNSLTESMITAFDMQLSAWAKVEHIKAVVVRAAEGRAFCAGGDIRKIYEAGKQGDASIAKFFWNEYRLNRRIFHYKKPYISLLDGITMGGGVGISIHGSHRVGTERLVFAMPETGIGFFPDVGGSYFLPRCPGKIGLYLGLSGERLQAVDALAAKLIDCVISSERIDELLHELVDTDFSQDNYAAVTALLNKFHTPPSEQASLITQRNDIDVCFDANNVQEILEKLKSVDNAWANKVAKIIASKSPTSLQVTFRQLQNGSRLDFDECMKMEYRMVNRFLTTHDFLEGVRAAIIDKDQAPQWVPGNLAEVSEEMVAGFFAPLTTKQELRFE